MMKKQQTKALFKKKKKDFVRIVSFPQLAVLLKSSYKKWTACDQLDLSSESCYSKIVYRTVASNYEMFLEQSYLSVVSIILRNVILLFFIFSRSCAIVNYIL